MLDIEKLPSPLYRALFEMLDKGSGDTAAQMSHLTFLEAFDLYLRHEGIIGFTEQIFSAVVSLQNAQRRVE